MLVTTPAKKSVQSRLQEKGKYRKKGGASGILGMYPAGTGELGVIKSRDEFLEGREGDELWYKHVEENTSGFEFLLNSYMYSTAQYCKRREEFRPFRAALTEPSRPDTHPRPGEASVGGAPHNICVERVVTLHRTRQTHSLTRHCTLTLALTHSNVSSQLCL